MRSIFKSSTCKYLCVKGVHITIFSLAFLFYFVGDTMNSLAQKRQPPPEVRKLIENLSPKERDRFFSLDRFHRRQFIMERLSKNPGSAGNHPFHGRRKTSGLRYFTTDDGGETWTSGFSNINKMSSKGAVDPEAFVGPDGKVWIYYFGSNNTHGDPARSQPDDTWRILLAKSGDLGISFAEVGVAYLEQTGLTDPFVLRLRDGRFRMYISRGASVFSAISDDGNKFLLEDGDRVSDGHGGVPGALTLEDGTQLLFVCRRDGIYRAESKDGLEFDSFQLVLEAPQEKAICDPSPEKVGPNSYIMAYKEKPIEVMGPREDYVRIATSKDGLEWRKIKGVIGQGSVPSLLVIDRKNWKIYVSGPPSR